MIDVRALRENPQPARDSLVARGIDPELVDRLLSADVERRESLSRFETLRAEHKEFSRGVGKASPEDRPAILARAKEMAGEVTAAQEAADAAAARADELLWQMPNLVVEGVPAGGEDDFRVLEHVGTPRDFAAEGVTVKDHLDLGESLRAIDVKRGTKVSGARFYYLTGIGARLELALLTRAADRAEEAGFRLMITPTLVGPEIMAGTGFLGDHAEEVYHLPQDDLYLVGTSEVALAGYHSDEIIDVSADPLRYAGWSTCYRREAGSYGKDTRGIIRVHQFNKLEMFSFVAAEDAAAEHETFLELEREMLDAVELPYRIIDTAAGDLGASAARKFDCEAWLPSQERWMEVTSTSNCTTFQARRLGVRTRTDKGTTPVATVNGTLATTRWIVAFLENHQQADGSVHVPAALRPYLGGREVLRPEAA